MGLKKCTSDGNIDDTEFGRIPYPRADQDIVVMERSAATEGELRSSPALAAAVMAAHCMREDEDEEAIQGTKVTKCV